MCLSCIGFFVRWIRSALFGWNGTYFWFLRAFNGAYAWQETWSATTNFSLFFKYCTQFLESWNKTGNSISRYRKPLCPFQKKYSRLHSVFQFQSFLVGYYNRFHRRKLVQKQNIDPDRIRILWALKNLSIIRCIGFRDCLFLRSLVECLFFQDLLDCDISRNCDAFVGSQMDHNAKQNRLYFNNILRCMCFEISRSIFALYSKASSSPLSTCSAFRSNSFVGLCACIIFLLT